MERLFQKSKPYIAMISLQFGYAGMNVLTKIALNRGMNHFVLVVYRHAAATIVLAPFAFFIERKVRPKLTFRIFCQIFVLGLLGPVLDQNFYYMGLELTSATYASSLSNILPAMTFVMALIFRMERLNVKKLRSQAKIVGTIVSVGGAMLMTLYKGPILHMFWSPHHQSLEHNQTAVSPTHSKEPIKGSILLVASLLAWSALFILQAAVLKRYSAQLTLATLICFLGTLQATALSLVFVRDPSQWSLGWDINFLTAVYSGVVASAIAYYVQGLCMRMKGPVFATAFTPLMMIIVAIMESFIPSENIYLGSVFGGALIAVGLYAVLWGKMKDSNTSSNKNLVELPSNCQVMVPQNPNKVEDIETASNQPMSKGHQASEFNSGDTAISISGNNNPKM